MVEKAFMADLIYLSRLKVRYRQIFILILSIGFNLCLVSTKAQNIPVGTQLENYSRRSQLIGARDSTTSFSILPLSLGQASEGLRADSSIINVLKAYTSEAGLRSFKILPVTLIQQYNSHPSYNLNDGSMIPAKGYQTLLNMGFFAKYGALSVQLAPEFVFAENKHFEEFASHFGPADLPVRIGKTPYSRVSWGQTNIELTLKSVSIGLSNENMWWGPARRNSLMMSNSAAGFKHLSIKTSRPVSTPIGSFEAQMIAGRLEGSTESDLLPQDWRYLSGMVVSYQPRWTPGLFLGLVRSFQNYHKNLKTFGDYFPLLRPFQKVNDDNQDDMGRDGLDQLASFFARWLLSKAKAEIYVEYGKNDHAYNTRDFLMAPEHSRAYTLGLFKLIPYKAKDDEFIQVGIEVTRLEQSIDRLVRDAGEWYVHSPIVHGYTHKGTVLGSGIGPGGNFQSLNVSWIKELKQLGIVLERYEHNGDLASMYGYSQWVDFSAAAITEWTYKKLLLRSKLQGIQSINYQWKDGINGRPKRNVFNINAQLGIMYSF